MFLIELCSNTFLIFVKIMTAEKILKNYNFYSATSIKEAAAGAKELGLLHV